VLAALNHPNIAHVYGLLKADAVQALVMELVPGETLAARVARGAIPPDEALPIAMQIASALEAAHERGIVHRDLKPANVTLRPDGTVKVLDFGIAKMLAPLESGTPAGSGPTAMTETGFVLGTAAYMSPEQARGKAVDERTDVWAFGCVLYEMLAGRAAFAGGDGAVTLARVLEGRADFGALPSAVSPTVRRTLALCLQTDPRRRIADIRDVRLALDGAFEPERDAGAVMTARGSARITRAAWLVTAGAAAAAVTATLFIAGAGLRRDSTARSAPPTALTFILPDEQLLAVGNPSTLEISPDGRRVAYIAQQGNTRRIYVREMDGFDSRPVAGTEGASSLFFSPDGESVGFYSEGALRRVAIDGGISRRIVDVPVAPTGASWGDDGTIVYAPWQPEVSRRRAGAGSATLFRVSAAGGAPTEIVLDDSAALAAARDGRLDVRWPHHLPIANLALVAPGFLDTGASFGVVDLATGTFRALLQGVRPYYVQTGHIVFYSGPETVSIVAFDLERLEITGPAVPVAGDVLRPAGSDGRFSVSREGTMVYARGGFERRLVLVDRNGRESPVDVEPRGYRFPDASPDGRFVAVTVDPQPPEIWVVDLALHRAQPVSTGGYHLGAVWSPDGSRIAFGTNPGVAWVPWPGGGDATALTTLGFPEDWPRDDRMLATIDEDLVWIDVPSGTLTDWLVTTTFERFSSVSPDGRWVAYTSDVSGVDEIYVRELSGAPPVTLVSRGGGLEPRWSANGSEVYYRSGGTIMAVPVRGGSRFEVTGPPTELFTGDYDFSNDRNWDVLPNDPEGRFLMIRSSPGVQREIRVMTNWIEQVDFGAVQTAR
jgi:serine/threonine-protein kinase